MYINKLIIIITSSVKRYCFDDSSSYQFVEGNTIIQLHYFVGQFVKGKRKPSESVYQLSGSELHKAHSTLVSKGVLSLILATL